MALICETVQAETMEALRARRDAVRGADLVELRLDGVRAPDIDAAVSGRQTPVIVTCRPVREGGRFDGPEDERLSLLRRAVEAGADYVDVEWQADRRRFADVARDRLVLSHHVFDTTPADLPARVRAMQAEPCAVLKVAVMAHRLVDCLALRDAVRGTRRLVAIAMGGPGLITRLWPGWLGSEWTYAGTAAPGQSPTSDVAGVFRARDTRASTAVYGIAGQPLGHSASPAMHNAAFREAGMDAVYLPFETTDADDLLAFADALGARGLSVTAPLKTAVAARSRLEGVDASATGAVNTLKPASDGWVGANFDVEGFLAPLANRDWTVGTRALVLGAGGAARAVATGLRRRGLRVAVSARRAEAASRLAAAVAVETTPWPPAGDWPIVVNATPVGAWPHEDAAPDAPAFHPGQTVYDLVYNPRQTALLRRAKAAGAETISGDAMLLAQARRQWTWWTGRPVPSAAMAAALDRFLESRSNEAQL